MKNFCKNLLTLSLAALFLSACSSTVKRTKFSDKNMRVMIDPASVSVEHHVRIQSALVRSEKWAVVDRASGLEAIKKEQDLLHRSALDRYEDKEKWAQWGKLYGVGAVVVGHASCYKGKNFWQINRRTCNQFLNLVDANTGEVIVAVENRASAPVHEIPDWHEIVEKLNDAYPSAFKHFEKHEKLSTYESESKEHAVRQKETAISRGTANRQ